ncbi:Hypothetical protein FKW44_002852 [Caligus rogercresseyi]|uniref:Uncharacterized protein n=1 Tax=Caligus rogercresseyi TaxID=217165 RepID=A0A7T8KL02_CALRO|nr:Hypothetical protein FKW44_002852 [Caligus rogercresseyi]
MVLENTPPYSPERLLEEEAEENITINDNEAFEVIDLDEVLEGETWEDEMDGNEGLLSLLRAVRP